MVNLFKLYAHIKEVGIEEFKKEYKEKKGEVAQDPLTALNMQVTGYLGVMFFSVVASAVFFYKGLWYIGALFLFNLLIQGGQLLSTKNQVKMFKEMKAEEQKQIEVADGEM